MSRAEKDTKPGTAIEIAGCDVDLAASLPKLRENSRRESNMIMQTRQEANDLTARGVLPGVRIIVEFTDEEGELFNRELIVSSLDRKMMFHFRDRGCHVMSAHQLFTRFRGIVPED